MSTTKNAKSAINENRSSAIAYDYWSLLGGIKKKYPSKTGWRCYKFFNELKSKRDYDRLTTFPTKTDEMIIIKNQRIFSFCEHHLLPYFGYANIGYIPKNKVLGLSKFQRVIDKLASKPSLQEDLTQEIADLIYRLTHAKGVGVTTNCLHSCMFGRGIQNTESYIDVQVLKGNFKIYDVKQEFLQRISNEWKH